MVRFGDYSTELGLFASLGLIWPFRFDHGVINDYRWTVESLKEQFWQKRFSVDPLSQLILRMFEANNLAIP